MRRSNHHLLAQVEAKAEARKQQFEAANAKISARAGRNIFFAVTTGVVLALLVVAALAFKQFLLLPLALVVAALALYELATAFRKAGRRVPRVGVIIGGAVVVTLSAMQGPDGTITGMHIATGLLVVWRLMESLLPQFHVKWRSMIADLAAGVFTLVYIPFLLSLIVQLALIPTNGAMWVFSLLLLVILNDTGAYVCGLNFGKHKMSPRISPNKTWEGFVGGATVVVAAAVFVCGPLLGMPWWGAALLGLAVVCTATGGDLIESMIKRNLGVKDMSSFIPGHGGILDRLDSILPTSVPFYAAGLALGVL
ncbi:phosphatidate cytidylyltransferase [Leucobacter sp. OH2974_COT-288]|nr:phosphatidate cytidylyltransferase [Leucobacter sp. OH2974_COT-288]